MLLSGTGARVARGGARVSEPLICFYAHGNLHSIITYVKSVYVIYDVLM
jgi:hypothetical protein